MPLYEYECQECHRHTERRQKFSDPEITECPHCGGRLERVITAPAFSFAGGGWYKDLYSSAKPGGSGAGGAAEAPAAAAGETKSAGGGESKPAATPTAAPATAAPAPAGSSGGEKK